MLVAPFIGSFMGVLVRRLPADQPVIVGRSRCEHCGHALQPIDLLPIVSFMALRGRCRACHAPIARMHLGIELAATAVAVSAVWADPTPAAWAGCGLGWSLLALAWIDLEHLWLPDVLTLPLIVAGLAATALDAPDAIADHAAAAFFAYAGFRGLAAIYRRLRGRDGLGQGDAKLLAAGGAWLGLAALPDLLLLGALFGMSAAALLWLRRRAVAATTPLPFGPPLAAAMWGLWLLSQAGR